MLESFFSPGTLYSLERPVSNIRFQFNCWKVKYNKYIIKLGKNYLFEMERIKVGTYIINVSATYR